MGDHKVKITAKTEDQGGGLGFDLICVNPAACSAITDGTSTCVVQVVWQSTGSELLVSDEGSILTEFSVDAEWSGTGEDSELWLVIDEE